MPIRAAIFDAYGTLLDVHSAMAAHADRLGAEWPRISQDWRIKQLEYSWIRSLAGPHLHRDFAHLTREALGFVAAKHGITDAALIDAIELSYRRLATYPEVPAMLSALAARGIARAILSNGEPVMLAEGVKAAGIAEWLDDVLSIEAVGVFKPDPRVYTLAGQRFGLANSDMAFISSNAWDAFAARENGFRVFWVNRSAQPDEYGLAASVTVLPDLSSLPDRLT